MASRFSLIVTACVGCGSVSGLPDAARGDASVEDCFNGLDDDANGQADCADPSCAPDATCVPVATGAGLEPGVIVPPDQACPPGFGGGETLLYRGLSGGMCDGCDCTPGTTTCTAEVWTYDVVADCTADSGQTGGVYAGIISSTCPSEPIAFSMEGARAVITANQGCSASGTASPGAVGWQESSKFCRAERVGTGCAAESACVPLTAPTAQCALATGAATCTGYGSTAPDWYTGVSDTRTCGACECTGIGGSCTGVQIQFGNDWTCTDSPLLMAGGEQKCEGRYAPKAQTIGTPADPNSCTSGAPVGGSLDPRGQSTLCCNP